MSGVVVGIVDAVTSLSGASGMREQFIYTKRFFDRQIAVGNAALVASNFGSGGTGFDPPYDPSANTSGENAWFVVRMLASASTRRSNDFYVLVQWAYTDNFGATPGNPGLCNGTAAINGVGLILAYREDGGNPWNGTSNADGADTKGTPVWADGPSTAHLITTAPEVNSENTHQIFKEFAANTRCNLVGDADTFFFASNSNDYYYINSAYAIMGSFEPLPGVTHPNPLFMVAGNNDVDGDVFNGNVASRNGGLMGVDESDEAQSVIMCGLPGNTESADPKGGMPSVQGASARSYAFPIYLIQATGTVNSGLIGTIPTEVAMLTTSTVTPTANATLTKAFIALGNTSYPIFVLCWGGFYPPGTGSLQNGWSF